MLGLFTAPGGSWVFESRRGTGEPVTALRVSSGQARRRVADHVGLP